MPTVVHLHPTAPLAGRVLLPGDPGRALLLAQTLLATPKMFNHNRGLWGYTGLAPDGEPLTVQSTGMGGPSAAIVIEELIALGAKRLVRVGTCGALGTGLALGALLVAGSALPEDGTSRALGADARVDGDPGLIAALSATGSASRITVACTDLFFEHRGDREASWRARGAAAVEMETATLYALAARHGLPAASLLIVADLVGPPRRRIEPEPLHAAEERAGRLALAALSAGNA
jgi:uridine phosphorylase